MHSGGGTKLYVDGVGKEKIYVELPEEAAVAFFTEKFRDPDNVTCNCCGPDYSYHTADSLEQASGYHRHCAWEGNGYVERPAKYYDAVIPLEVYLAQPDVLVIRLSEIECPEKYGSDDAAQRFRLLEL